MFKIMTEKFYYKSPIGILEIELKNDTIQSLELLKAAQKFPSGLDILQK